MTEEERMLDNDDDDEAEAEDAQGEDDNDDEGEDAQGEDNDGAEDAQEEDGEVTDFEEEEEEEVQPVASLEPVDDDDDEEEEEEAPEDPQPNFLAVGGPSDPEGCMVMPPQGRNPAEVYNDIRANMDNDPLHLSPISCQSPTYGEDVYQYPNNQSPEREHQEALFRDLWVIMRHYQTFIQRPVYDPPGEGNCGYYALAHALGLTSHDAHLKVRNDLLTELVNHRYDYVKLHSHGTKRRTRNRAQIVQDQANIELDVFESRLKHGGITAPRRKWFDSQMGFIVASAYARPFVILGDEPAGCMFYLPYRHRPSTKSPIIVGFIKGVHFVQMDPKEGQFFFPFFLLVHMVY